MDARRTSCRPTPLAASLFALSLLAGVATAAGADLTPGQYVTAEGWGVLDLHRAGDRTTFSLEAIGSNLHICSLDGEIRNGQAQLDAGDPQPCTVSFRPAADGIEVQASGETCRYFCGARAWFEGTYLKPAPGCRLDEIERSRKEFKRLYDRKDHAAAFARLEGVLKICEKTLTPLTAGWVRNDLAITLHKLGRLDECKRLLEPLAADAAKSDQTLREELPPSDFDNHLPMVKATRTNLRLCSGAAKPH